MTELPAGGTPVRPSLRRLPIARPAGVDPLSLVREVSPPTPLELAPGLDSRHELLLKREDQGPVGSFKWRGALCACAALRSSGASDVVTSSTGNHGAATAWAASRLGLRAHVVVPVDSSVVKRELIAEHGAELQEHGATLSDSAQRARALARELDAPLFVDGGCEAQLMGSETVGLELLDARADVVLTPLACGALAGGVLRALGRQSPRPRVIAVQSAAFARFSALWHGRPDPGPGAGTTFADGLADDRIVEPAFSACAQLDEILTVDDVALAAAVRELFDRCGMIVEGAAAAALAALRAHAARIPAGRVVLVISGRNLDQTTASQIFA
jgi:threonine dehydratase